MPSTKCPIVKDWGTGKIITAVMGIMHCNACQYAHEIHINYIDQTGEVYCAAPK